ncbi:hypothetical protein [Nonomuraea sp. NPDC005650]|uniref:hypothetical protein n=1 Tax=Nonomuraea sp. NPDC005650 TaxID=3157045 RepID=UPI0033A059E1
MTAVLGEGSSVAGTATRAQGKAFAVLRGVPEVLGETFAVLGAVGKVSAVLKGVFGAPEETFGVLGDVSAVFGMVVSRGSGEVFGVLPQVREGVTGLRGEVPSGPAALGVAQLAGAGGGGGGVAAWRGGVSGGRCRACVGAPLRRCG